MCCTFLYVKNFMLRLVSYTYVPCVIILELSNEAFHCKFH